MRSKTLLIGVGVVIGLLLAAAGIVLAGSLNPTAGPGDPGSQMYTLEQIYNRLSGSGNATKMTAFTEPSNWPLVGTMHTLDEIYALAWPARVPKTGQTTCYNNTLLQACPAAGFPRQDGELKKGVAWPSPRFTDNGNGTVTDNLTGLMWMKDANAGNDCAGADVGTETWATALASAAACNTGAGYAGQTDWRLPNLREMLSLIDYGRSGPALPGGHPFTNVQLGYYWTSTTVASTPSSVWVVGTSGGFMDYGGKTFLQYVWMVRGGP